MKGDVTMTKKYRILLACACAVTAVSLSACGDVSDSSSAVSSSKAETTAQTTETVQNSEADTSTDTTAPDVTSEPATDAVSKAESEVPDLTGTYIENQGSENENYIVINGTSGYICPVGSKSVSPLTIDLTADTIFVNRGGVSDVTDPSGYTFDGATVAFTQDGNTYLWSAIDYIPIEGVYHVVDDEGTFISDWTFNADGTGSTLDKENEMGVATSFTQTKDTLSISFGSADVVTDYSYVNNISTITLTDADGNVVNLQADGV